MRLTPGRVERGFRRSFAEWEAWRSGASPSSGRFVSQSTFKGYCSSPSPEAYSCAHGYCPPATLMGHQLGPVVACGAHEKGGVAGAGALGMSSTAQPRAGSCGHLLPPIGPSHVLSLMPLSAPATSAPVPGGDSSQPCLLGPGCREGLENFGEGRCQSK